MSREDKRMGSRPSRFPDFRVPELTCRKKVGERSGGKAKEASKKGFTKPQEERALRL